MIAAVNCFLRFCVLAVILACAPILITPLHADFLTSFGSGGNQFNMVFVPIGNPGNAADTAGSPNPAGSVGHHYNMGKYEVSRDMVSKANSAGGLGITLGDLTSAGGNGANRPAGVSWNEAARFVNWLNTSQGFSAAYKFTTQPGESGYTANENIQQWLPTDAGYNAANLFRNSQAKYFLPSMDEWYKAAYYDPNKFGTTDGYWKSPTKSDWTFAVSGGTAPETAVYNQSFGQGPADITNAGGLSAYGVMGMGGNVMEWLETESPWLSSERCIRGGSWSDGYLALDSTHWTSVTSTSSSSNFGFRVASVPEPSSAGILMALSTAVMWQRRRRTG